MSKGRGTSGRGSVFPWMRRDSITGKVRQAGYVGTFSAGRDPDTGKRRRVTVYGKTEREVVDKLTDELAKHKNGARPKPGPKTVEAFLGSWLKRLDVKPRTYEHYELVIRRHVLPVIGSKTLSKLTPGDVEQLIANRREAGLAPRSLHHVRAVLRNALKDAERDGLVARNAASLAKPPRVPRVEMRTLEPAQVAAFIAAVRGDPLEALYVVTLGLGLRQGEAFGLRWDDIDLDAGVLRVTHALQWLRPRGGHAGAPHLVEPKSQESRRTLRMPRAVVAALRDHRARWRDRKLELGSRWVNEWGLVFVGPFGQPLNPRAVWDQYKAVLERAGLPRELRFHDLRHSAASLLGARHVPARVVQEILGHSSIHITLQTYSHVFKEQHEAAAEAMDGVLGG